MDPGLIVAMVVVGVAVVVAVVLAVRASRRRRSQRSSRPGEAADRLPEGGRQAVDPEPGSPQHAVADGSQGTDTDTDADTDTDDVPTPPSGERMVGAPPDTRAVTERLPVRGSDGPGAAAHVDDPELPTRVLPAIGMQDVRSVRRARRGKGAPEAPARPGDRGPQHRSPEEPAPVPSGRHRAPAEPAPAEAPSQHLPTDPHGVVTIPAARRPEEAMRPNHAPPTMAPPAPAPAPAPSPPPPPPPPPVPGSAPGQGPAPGPGAAPDPVPASDPAPIVAAPPAADVSSEPTTAIPLARENGHGESVDPGRRLGRRPPKRTLADRLRGRHR